MSDELHVWRMSIGARRSTQRITAPFNLKRPARQAGRMGYLLLWLLGIPLPVLFVIYLLRGCN